MSWTTSSGHFPQGIDLNCLHCHVSTFPRFYYSIGNQFKYNCRRFLELPSNPSRLSIQTQGWLWGTRNPNFLLWVTKDPPVRSRLKPWVMTGGREYPLGIGKQDQPLTRSISYDQRIRPSTAAFHRGMQISMRKRGGSKQGEIWFFDFLIF